MDIQKLLDAMSDMPRNTRSDYHLTLGELTEKLASLPADTPVRFDDGMGVGEEDSYRGFYSDLAFATGAPDTMAASVLLACHRAATNTYTGYKGGDFKYGPDTPLWRGEWGCCGPAIIAALEQDGKLILVTKDLRS